MKKSLIVLALTFAASAASAQVGVGSSGGTGGAARCWRLGYGARRVAYPPWSAFARSGVGGLSHRSPLAATRSLARGMPTGPTSFRNEFQKSGSKENL